MPAHSALVVHHQPEILDSVRRALDGEGFRVLACRSHRQAIEQLEGNGFFDPDVLLTELESGSQLGSTSLAHLRSHPLTEKVAVVVLAGDDPDHRRRALRLGLTHLVTPPYDPEEVMLRARLALEQREDDHLLSGSLTQLPITDLLQTAEATRKTGTISLESQGVRGTFWVRGGRVIDAELDNLKGREAAFALIGWDKGRFEADFGPVSLPERIEEPTSHLLLEAMRRRDEADRQAEIPPHAALPDPPPAPPRDLRALHRGLTLLTITASYGSNHLQPQLLRRRLESARQEAMADHGVLELFRLDEQGRASVFPELDPLPKAEAIVPAIADWLRRFFAATEKALPGRFDLRRLNALSGALQEDLEELGFHAALGFEPDPEETPS